MRESRVPVIRSNVDLQACNTLALPVRAAQFCEVDSINALRDALRFAREAGHPVCILGGGSNVVFQGDFPGLVIRIALRGVRVESQGDERLVYAAAGESWDALVRHCLIAGWYGIENLIAIPGSVGAAPVQNIGAYGAELSHTLHSVCLLDIATLEERVIPAADCELAYRDSIFKQALRDRVVITEICLRLTTHAVPNLSYPALLEALPDVDSPSPELVAQTIDVMRAAKLPNVDLQPNAGSFFKNPIVPSLRARELLSEYPVLAHWPMADGRVKLAAAWLVDQCGWKGRRLGGVGVHPRQAIVLVNYDRADPQALLALAAAIQRDVREKFMVELEIEPRLY